MAQIINITSESLQALVRRLLPSQQGFGEDLQASNVIQPIIDLTPTAEGSVLRSDLQVSQEIASTFTNVTGASSVISSTPGFYSIVGGCHNTDTTTNRSVSVRIDDGITTTTAFSVPLAVGTNIQLDFPIFFVGIGETLTLSAGTNVTVRASSRQVADVNGNLTNPSGFTSE